MPRALGEIVNIFHGRGPGHGVTIRSDECTARVASGVILSSSSGTAWVVAVVVSLFLLGSSVSRATGAWVSWTVEVRSRR